MDKGFGISKDVLIDREDGLIDGQGVFWQGDP